MLPCVLQAPYDPLDDAFEAHHTATAQEEPTPQNSNIAPKEQEQSAAAALSSVRDFLDARDAFGSTALEVALDCNMLDIAAVLAEAGACLPKGVLHAVAAATQIPSASVAGFIKAVAQKSSHMMEERDERGDNPLHVAARCGHVVAIQALLTNGGSKLAAVRDSAGLVALHLAAMGGYGGALLALLHGCSAEAVRARTPEGRTALHLLAYGLASPGGTPTYDSHL